MVNHPSPWSLWCQSAAFGAMALDMLTDGRGSLMAVFVAFISVMAGAIAVSIWKAEARNAGSKDR